MPGFVFAADLIRGSGAWSAADESALRTWLHDLILPNLPVRAGNWGDAGDFSRAAITDFLGDSAGFAKALDEWRARMDAVPADGHLPDEVRRGSDGMSYTQEALQYKVAVARLAELRGVDLWSYVGRPGATLRGAIGSCERYWFVRATGRTTRRSSVPSPSPMWEIAYQHWQDSGWTGDLRSERPFGGDAHSAIRWTTLTNGIAVPSRGDLSGGSRTPQDRAEHEGGDHQESRDRRGEPSPRAIHADANETTADGADSDLGPGVRARRRYVSGEGSTCPHEVGRAHRRRSSPRPPPPPGCPSSPGGRSSTRPRRSRS